MSAALEAAVGLLERSLGYTRAALQSVDPDDLHGPTPCADWDLAQLLSHMDDALDSFTEAAAGVVAVDPPVAGLSGTPGSAVDVLQGKACALLGAWMRQRPSTVRLGDPTLRMGGPLLVVVAALEITVHGWDVARATGLDHPIPAALARELLAVAHLVVDPCERGVRFAPARPVLAAPHTAYDARLLAFLGRDPAHGPSRTGPLGKALPKATPRDPLAS